jgi:hypothetical protein
MVYALNKAADKLEQKEAENNDEDSIKEETPDIDLENIDDIEGVEGKDFDINDF